MRIALAFAAFCLFPPPLHAQCSDAGACAAGRFQEEASDRITLTTLGGASGSPDDVRYSLLKLEGQFQAGRSTRLLITVPFTRAAGPLGSTAGLGDVIGILDQSLARGEGWSLAGQIGGRFATGDDARDPALPQAYQTGLGPADLILGLRGSWSAWQAGVAYQKAGGRNRNPLNRLKRGDDALAWVSREVAWGGTALTFKTLVIQRLGLSSVRDLSSSAEAFVDVPRSDRLQVNLEAALAQPIGSGLDLQIVAVAPLLSRPTNVDGLKRAWTASVGVSWSF